MVYRILLLMKVLMDDRTLWKIFRDDFGVQASEASQWLQVASKTNITPSVPPSLNPPLWTRILPWAIYLLVLEEKFVHPPLHKSSQKISCKSNVSRRKQRRIMILET
ncbi:hypothetical protein MKX03_001672 [Papaver bracteatum]|nr:hypothetical protein MKX03_001672 [Papaver bracteatum]